MKKALRNATSFRIPAASAAWNYSHENFALSIVNIIASCRERYFFCDDVDDVSLQHESVYL
jgi:hypothetical protein